MVQLAELQRIEDCLIKRRRPKGIASLQDLEVTKTRIEMEIEARVLRYYRRVREKYDNAVVKIEDGFCPGCRMRIPPLIAQEIRRGGSFHSCNTCGRILLWP